MQGAVARSSSTAIDRHCERGEEIHTFFTWWKWIASRSLSSVAHSRDPLARNDDGERSPPGYDALGWDRSPEYQNHVVGGHLGGLDQRQAVARREPFQRLDIAHPPFGIPLAEAC